ncbi:MAG: TIR domain-containing protein [Alphaproteobacteria bacterium]
MASVFLSYSREDVSKAHAVAAALERHGHQVWWDRQIHGGSRFSKEIEQALKSADVVIVLWSRASIESAWVQDEAAEGRDSDRLVPVLIDDSQPPLGFRQYQAIDLSGWKGRPGGAIKTVHEAIVAKSGIQPVGPAERRPAPPFRGRRPLAAAAAAFVAILVAGLAYWLFATSGRAEPTPLRLQLGEFKALSQEVPAAVPETLREELLEALATDSVIVATTAPGKGSSDSGYALSATVRNTGEDLLFTIHVTNPQSGAALWSETLARPAARADLAPRQAAVAVSQVLRCGLGGAARYGRPLPDDSLSLYLSFCEEYWADTAGKAMNPSRALDFAQRLTEASPDFARGWASLAEVAAWPIPGERATSTAAVQARAIAAAHKAIKLDPEDSEGYQALANLQPPLAHTERERLHLKSISVRPGDCGCEYVSYGSFLNRVGRNADATNAYRRAHDMIPLSAEVNMRWAEGLFMIGRAEEARRIVAEVLRIWPEYGFVRDVLLRNALWTRDYGEASELLADRLTPLTEKERATVVVAINALRSGDEGGKSRAIAAIRDLGGENFNDARLPILLLALLGAEQEALSLAARLLPKEKSRAMGVLYDPPLAGARHRPEFAKLAQQLGLVSYWKSSGKSPDFCKERGAPALCAKL